MAYKIREITVPCRWHYGDGTEWFDEWLGEITIRQLVPNELEMDSELVHAFLPEPEEDYIGHGA